MKLAKSTSDDDLADPSRNLQQARRTKSKRGFDIHAAVGVMASDGEGRERLLRYCARAPLSLERLAVLPDGRIAWRIGIVSLGERGPGTDARTTQAESPALPEPQPTGQPAVGSKSQLQPRTGIDWATLLRRVYDLDALACGCGGRLRVIALITEPAVAMAILDSVALPSQPPPVARARSPDDHDSAPE